MTKVAVVTGSNKGIGFGIVRALCKQFKGDVYLTSRDVARGQEAVKDLQKEGLNPLFHQLDICDRSSIEGFKQELKTKYGGVDVLVNNAGLAYKGSSTAPFSEQANVSVKTNYEGTLNMCMTFFPILNPGARVVNVSSSSSTYVMKNVTKARFEKIKAASTIDQVNSLMAEFVSAAQNNKHKEDGWIDSAYGASKVGVTIMTPIQQKIFDQDVSRSDIVVNSCCPGYVNTDMSSHQGPLTIDQGADTPVYLAMLPPNVTSPRGEFVKERKVIIWKDSKL